jgi:hypothetical protein
MMPNNFTTKEFIDKRDIETSLNTNEKVHHHAPDLLKSIPLPQIPLLIYGSTSECCRFGYNLD